MAFLDALDWGAILYFFEPVFNLADTAISTGVGIILVFNKRIFPKIKTL